MLLTAEQQHLRGLSAAAGLRMRALLCNAAAPVQVDVDGKPWPLDAEGKPILKQ